MGIKDGRFFSVALSVESPRLAVSQHPILLSSDFPPAILWTTGDYPTYSVKLSFL